ncbi:MAG: efflux RND transporter periplasmic adaptor subunit [Pseudomonadota bacterium]
MKKRVIILVILLLAGLGAFRAAQVISAKKEKPEARGGGRVPIVEADPVTLGLIEDKIVRNGDIAANAQVTVYSKVQGWVGKIHVREGDLVKPGQEIVTLDKREAEASVAQAKAGLEAARARLKQVRATSEETIQSQIEHAKANMELAEADLARMQRLFDKDLIARQQMDESRMKYKVAKAAYDLAMNHFRQKTWENDIALAEAQVNLSQATLELNQAQLGNLIILSPMKGVVTKRYVDAGTMVKDTAPILTLMDLSEMKMMVNVIEREFIHLKKGQPVKISIAVFSDHTFSGSIDVITPALDLQSRTAEIQISIPNSDFVLKPGMFGRAEIVLRSNPQAVLVPIQSVITEVDKDFVFVLKENRVSRRPVKKGVVRDTVVEILQGVIPGEQVVTAGHASLHDGAQVRLSLQSGR